MREVKVRGQCFSASSYTADPKQKRPLNIRTQGRKNLCHLICRRHLICSRAVSNRIFLRKDLFSCTLAQHVLIYNIMKKKTVKHVFERRQPLIRATLSVTKKESLEEREGVRMYEYSFSCIAYNSEIEGCTEYRMFGS